MSIEMQTLRPLFAPRSIAVVGASATPGKIGATALSLLQHAGFRGSIYPVSPGKKEIAGLKAYSSVLDIDASVDMAIFAVPASQAPIALSECLRKGVRAGVMFTSGFAELGEEGARTQANMAKEARRGGMRLLGPNCLGIANYRARMFASFSPVFASVPETAGHMALVSQSGAFGGYAATAAQDLGVALSFWMTTGNEADVDLADGLAFLADDPQTRVILAYMEGCRNGPKLCKALEKCRQARKPIVILKVGRTEVGAEAASSHTASLAGADNIYGAIFRQYDAYRAETIDEWFDVGRAAANGRFPASARTALVTVSGGVGVFMADEAVDRGLDVAPLDDQSQAAIKNLVPFAGTRNPIDITGQVVADIGLFEKTIETVAACDHASVVAFHGAIGRSPVPGGKLLSAWSGFRARHPDKVVAIAGASTRELDEAYSANGCLTFQDPGRAVRAIAALHRLRAAFDRPKRPFASVTSQQSLPKRTLTEVESLAVLTAAGVPAVPHRLSSNADEAVNAARDIGYPVALKIVSPDILHKSDVGGVALSLANDDQVRHAFDRVMDKAKTAAPQARLDGCLVAHMVRGGVEVILGVQSDPAFGPMVMFGLGGVMVEVLHDVSFRAAPFEEDEALRMIAETKAALILKGVRGGPPADIEALARVLSRLSAFAFRHADQIKSIDINPVLVRPIGQGVVALDAVIVGSSEDSR